MEVIVLKDEEAVARFAADIMEGYVRKGATLGLATGSTPVATYKELIRRHRDEGLSFSSCQAFLLDEYVGLGSDHEQSYYQTIRRDFTHHVDIEDALVFSPDPEKGPEVYDRSIAEAGGVDVQILGIGTDGHVGFNEPGSSLVSRTRMKTLHEQTIADNARFFNSPEEVPIHVLTQGLGTIREARHLLLIATGEGKAEAIANTVEGPVSARCPGSALQLHERVTVIIDEAAACKLEDIDYYRFAFENSPTWN